jgi:penicillin-binding protein 1A
MQRHFNYGPEGPIKRFFYWLAAVSVWLIILSILSIAWLARDLPDLETLPPPGLNDRIEVQSEDGELLATYGAIYGEWLDYEQIPEAMVKALVAVEDRRFFEHGAIDLRGILRAFLSNLRSGSFAQGGSSLTQQLAKNLFLTRERTLTRKVKELLLASWLEGNLGKEDILTIYLNRVYFGAGAYGLEAASRNYFGHPARRLSIAEAAMLAGLLKAPSSLAPTRNPVEARARGEIVLAAMRRESMISQTEQAQAKAAPPKIDAAGRGGNRRYFTDWVAARARQLVDDPGQPLVVVSSLNRSMQLAAEQAVAAGLGGEGQQRQATQAALVALTTDGAVKAMVGGRSFHASQFNRAVSARRQPGSAFKLFVYLAALEAGWKPEKTMIDAAIDINGWSPKNFDGKFRGEISLREAFAQSINTISVRLSEEIGRGQVVAAAQRLGLGEMSAEHPSLALGTAVVTPLELTGAYAVIASSGHEVKPFAILEIRSADGELLYRRANPTRSRIIARENVTRMARLLEEVVVSGTGRAARIARPAGGKTGTSQDFRDAWFLGFSSELVTGVWVGNDNNQPMKGVTGGGLPARIWAAFMRPAHQGLPVRPLLADSQPD